MAALRRVAALALAVTGSVRGAINDEAAPTPAPTTVPSYSVDITRTDKMAYTLIQVDNSGNAVRFGTVDVTNALVSKATDSATTTVTDNYELIAGCYKLETYSTAVQTKYTRPELWSWRVGTEVAGYGFDSGIFGVGGELCGIPSCFDNCRQDNEFTTEWSVSDVCNNYGLLLRDCKCAAAKDQSAMAQKMFDANCQAPAPYIVNNNLGVAVKKITITIESHKEYNTTLSLLLSNTAVPDSNIPRSFQTQVEGSGLATFLGVYPWSKVNLLKVNANDAEDVISSRRQLREGNNDVPPNIDEDDTNGRRLQTSTNRKLTRLTFSIDAYEKMASNQDARYAFLEAKPQDDFSALNMQLRSTVTLLKAPSTLMSTEGYSKTRDVVDSVTIEVEYLGPTPDPTPAPTHKRTPATEKPVPSGKLQPTTQPPVSKSGSGSSSGGASGMGLYIGLAAAGLVGLGALYCCIGGAIRNKKAGKAQQEEQAAKRAADDEAFRQMQAANAAKLAAANGPAAGVPLD